MLPAGHAVNEIVQHDDREVDVVRGDLQRVDGPEERLEDDPVGAAGAPDVGQLPGPDVLIVIEGHYRTSLIFSRIWAGVMGAPSTPKMPSTAHRPFAHRSTSKMICPSDSSGTMIALTRGARR